MIQLEFVGNSFPSFSKICSGKVTAVHLYQGAFVDIGGVHDGYALLLLEILKKLFVQIPFIQVEAVSICFLKFDFQFMYVNWIQLNQYLEAFKERYEYLAYPLGPNCCKTSHIALSLVKYK